MVAHEREADHADGLEDARAEDREALRGVALELVRDVRALDEHGGDDDQHADEGQPRGARELRDVAVERERVGEAQRAERDDELPVGEPGEDRHVVEFGEDGADDMWDCVACVVLFYRVQC